MDVLLILLPVIVVLALLVFLKWSADTSGLVGWLLTLAIAAVVFQTPVEVGLTASLYGLLLSFPISLMVATSIFQITFMESTGALQRVVVFVKTIAKSDKAVQIMIINMGIGTLLVSVGATPVSILPPIMLALGYSTFVAVALPAIGFDSLCTYALLGAPLVAFVQLTGGEVNDTTLAAASQIFSMYMPVISTLIGFGMLWIVGGFKQVKEGLLPCLLAGFTMGCSAIAVAYIGKGIVLTGVFGGLATVCIMLLYLLALKKPILDNSVLTPADLEVKEKMSLGAALAPWIILVSACLFINFYPPVLKLLRDDLRMAVSIIPTIFDLKGQALAKQAKPAELRMLWQAYTWVLISTFAAVAFVRPSAAQWKDISRKWVKRAPRPVLSAAIFFAIAYVMVYSGYSVFQGGWQIHADMNMVSILAQSSAAVFKGMYPIIGTYLGLLGGFITGSEASAIAMLAKYHLETSALLKLNGMVVLAGAAIAGGLASVISPAKLQNAAATIDALGIESEVIKVTVVISIIFTAVAAVLTYMWA